MRRIWIVAAVALATSACTAPSATRETLRKQGFKDIAVGGYAFFSCGKDDTFATKFQATNVSGERVEGVVCCGLLKSCTVRF